MASPTNRESMVQTPSTLQTLVEETKPEEGTDNVITETPKNTAVTSEPKLTPDLEAARTSNDIIISCDGPDDRDNCRNWSRHRKWVITMLMSVLSLVSAFSTTMVTPALHQIAKDINVEGKTHEQLMMSIYLLGYAAAPLLIGPLSELYGRQYVIQGANLVYLIFNTGCGFAKAETQMLALRFLSGVGASAPAAVCYGVLTDIWAESERGTGLAIYGVLTCVGPCIGPIIGAFINRSKRWGWIFWTISAFDLIPTVLTAMYLKETYAPVIEKRRAEKMKNSLRAQGNDAAADNVKTQHKSASLRKRFVLPIVMFSHPAVLVPSVIRACFYGIAWLVLSTFIWVFEDIYHQPTHLASLNYLALLVGFLIALVFQGKLADTTYAYFKRRNGDEGVPEYRAPLLLVGSLLSPAGLFLYGWTALYKVHFIVTDIGVALIAAGLIFTTQAAQLYVADTYGPQYAASASATGAFLRVVCGFLFTLIGPKLYSQLGNGWGNSLLGFVTLVLSIGTPALLWFYGAKIRRMSTRGLDKEPLLL